MVDETIREVKDAERKRAADWQQELNAAIKPKDDILKLVKRLEASAIQQCKDEELTPHPDNSDDLDVLYRYDAQQGYKAAHYARQDTIVIFALAVSALQQLRHLQKAAYLIIALLAAVLYKIW